jgi:hypothetical protein
MEVILSSLDILSNMNIPPDKGGSNSCFPHSICRVDTHSFREVSTGSILPAPPGDLVTKAMIVAVVGPEKWHCEFVADLAAQGLRLGEPQMMGSRNGRVQCGASNFGTTLSPGSSSSRPWSSR